MIGHDHDACAVRRAIAATVRALRERAGLTVQQLADHVGVDVDELRAVEAGEPSPLGDALLALRAAAAGGLADGPSLSRGGGAARARGRTARRAPTWRVREHT